MSRRTLDDLKTDFVQAAINYGEDLGSGTQSSRVGERAFKAAEQAFYALAVRGEQDQILALLEFAHPAVRLVAAGFALRFKLDEQRGEATLESVSRGRGAIAAMAAGSLAGLRYRQRKSVSAA